MGVLAEQLEELIGQEVVGVWYHRFGYRKIDSAPPHFASAKEFFCDPVSSIEQQIAFLQEVQTQLQEAWDSSISLNIKSSSLFFIGVEYQSSKITCIRASVKAARISTIRRLGRRCCVIHEDLI